VYDHEHRIAYALAGKSHRIRREPEPTPVVHVRRTAPSRMISTESRASKNEEGTRERGSDTNGRPDWMKQVFQ
jgi:hypothetical protein